MMGDSILDMINPSVSYPQSIYLTKLTTPFKAYVGGYGSGKTFVGCTDLVNFASVHPRVIMAYFGPTYGNIRDVFYPTIEEVCKILGFTCNIKVANREVELFRGPYYYGNIICRSMDNPNSIVGFKFSRALVDEIDLLPNVEKQSKVWNKIIARRRGSTKHRTVIGVTTTPEGFKHVYNLFADKPTKSYSMVQASTYENAKHLPDDYISTLEETYTSELVEAYIKGRFVNLTSGSVYNMFDRLLNHSDAIIRPNQHLHIGMDFNVTNMSAVVHVIGNRNNNPIAVDEIVGAYDTPAMIAILKERYQGHRISVYPDASGTSRKSVDASVSDIAELDMAGYACVYDSLNPRIKDRVQAMNRMFLTVDGTRRYKVNTVKCPEYTKNLEQQNYGKSGLPDKTSGNDHMLDASGYFINQMYPINKPKTIIGYQLSI